MKKKVATCLSAGGRPRSQDESGNISCLFMLWWLILLLPAYRGRSAIPPACVGVLRPSPRPLHLCLLSPHRLWTPLHPGQRCGLAIACLIQATPIKFSVLSSSVFKFTLITSSISIFTPSLQPHFLNLSSLLYILYLNHASNFTFIVLIHLIQPIHGFVVHYTSFHYLKHSHLSFSVFASPSLGTLLSYILLLGTICNMQGGG